VFLAWQTICPADIIKSDLATRIAMEIGIGNLPLSMYVCTSGHKSSADHMRTCVWFRGGVLVGQKFYFG